MLSRRVRNTGVVACLGAALGCTSTEPAAPSTRQDVEKRDALERVSHAEDRWYRVAWGQERRASERAATAVRFECVWEGLRARDVDPRPDLECLARAMTAAAECQSAGKPVPECNRAFEQACTFSTAYLDLAKVCRTDTK